MSQDIELAAIIHSLDAAVSDNIAVLDAIIDLEKSRVSVPVLGLACLRTLLETQRLLVKQLYEQNAQIKDMIEYTLNTQ